VESSPISQTRTGDHGDRHAIVAAETPNLAMKVGRMINQVEYMRNHRCQDCKSAFVNDISDQYKLCAMDCATYVMLRKADALSVWLNWRVTTCIPYYGIDRLGEKSVYLVVVPVNLPADIPWLHTNRKSRKGIL